MVDPYLPPRSQLERGVYTAAAHKLPASVAFSVRLLLASAALILLFLAVVTTGIFHLPEENGLETRDLVSNVLAAVALTFIASKLTDRKRWARRALTVGVVLGGAVVLYGLASGDSGWSSVPIAVSAFNVLQCGLQLAAVVLLFVREANQWFSKSDLHETG